MSDDTGYIREMLGRIDGKLDSVSTALSVHASHDETVQKALFERIETLQLAHASQKGGSKVWAMVATGAGAIVGSLTPLIATWLKHRQ